MSEKKKLKKYGDIRIPAQSLHPPDKDGYLTKQGGSIKTWKRRYFILKGRTLYYYKTPKDQTITGLIDLQPSSVIKEEPAKKKGAPNMFSITTAKRVFYMFPDKPEETTPWVEAIQKGIETAKSGGGSVHLPVYQDSKSDIPDSNEYTSPRQRLKRAKNEIYFLKPEDSKVLEFWQIWTESIPDKAELAIGTNIEYTVSTTADMQKLTWRVAGPQNVFIQKMVDFFWNVGAPESEIDRLNDVGALVNPVRIGSWIDMSAKGGMDGGWYFPVDITTKMALEAADSGDSVKKFTEWAENHNLQNCMSLGRDMGAAPPRQTEIRVKLPGNDSQNQINIALDAWKSFDIPTMPEQALKILKDSNPEPGLILSVITSSEGFVRIGISVPKPSTDTVLALCALTGANNDELASFEASIGGPGAPGPAYVEYQHLMKGFGYGVYKEEFDVIFHYKVGEEIGV